MNVELARSNKIATFAHIVNVLVLVSFAIYYAIQGVTGWIRPIVMIVVGLGVAFTELILYLKKPDNKAIKYLVLIGYALFFAIEFFTSPNNIDFVFVIPMILVFIIYNDEKFLFYLVIGVVIENIVSVSMSFTSSGNDALDKESAIMQLMAIILVSVYAFIMARTMRLNNKDKVKNLEKANVQTNNILQDVSHLTESLKEGIEEVHGKIDQLTETTNVTNEAMREVSNGATDTADAVQNQIYQTQEIQIKVDRVNSAASGISDKMVNTIYALKEGAKNIKLLSQKTATSVKNGRDVADKLQNLDKYMEEMNSIVGLIENITSQTSLLSLNASIEAARAGEAGKGFAVVASEISSMAGQTQDATTQIAELIANVSNAIGEVVKVIYQMLEGINDEKESTEKAVGSFDVIEKNTNSIKTNVDELAVSVSELKRANQEIVDSIQTISVISEEVTARSEETMEAEQKNLEVLVQIKNKMQELFELAK